MVIGNHLLNKKANATRPTLTATVQGGDVETFIVNPTQSRFKIRISSPTGNEQVIGGREDAVVTHVGYCNPDIDVVRNDHLIVGDFRFDVLMVLPPSVAHHLKLLLEEVPGKFNYIVSKPDEDAIIMKNEDGTESILEFKD